MQNIKKTHKVDHEADWRWPLKGRALYNNIKTDILRNNVGAVVGPSMHRI